MKKSLFLPLLFILPFSLGFAQDDISKREQEIIGELQLRAGSFRSIILGNQSSALIKDLSAYRRSCGATLKKHYQNGKSLYSKTFDEGAKRFGSLKFPSRIQDDTFYHYTANETFMSGFDFSHKELVEKGTYEEIFIYQRIRSNPAYSPNWSRVFYLSEDPDSLRSWSKYGIEFRLDMNSRMIKLEPNFMIDAMTEIGLRYPEIGEACGNKLDAGIQDAFSYVSYNPMIFLMAEDSDISVIDYNQANHWFQIVSPKAFVGARAMGAVGGTSRDPSLSDQSQDQLDLSDPNHPRIVKQEAVTPAVISVSYAEFGGRDVTTIAQEFLNGKIRETYKVTTKRLGEPAPGTSADFKLEWKCMRNDKPVGKDRKMELLDANKKSFLVKCD